MDEEDDPRPTGSCAVCYRSCYLDSTGNLPWHLPTIALRPTHEKGQPCRGTGSPPTTHGTCATCCQRFSLSHGNIPDHYVPVRRRTSVVVNKRRCEGSSRAPRDPALPLGDSKADRGIRITATGHPGSGRRS